jgi:hypothetical protein
MVTIIGKYHDNYSDGIGKAPITFQLQECYNTKYRMNSSDTNVESWNNSQMRSTHIPAILKLMPTEVQSALREVNKHTTNGDTGSTIVTTADKLFLLSEVEVFGVSSNSKGGEGIRYEYYAKSYTPIKKVNGTNSIYWLRSPQGINSTGFCCVGNNGGANYQNAATTAGVSFAFCF